jgi:hypothetical protein
MRSTADAADRELVVAPGALAGLGVLGIAAVLLLPGIAHHLPLPGRVAHDRYALACAGVIVLTALYVVAVSTTRVELGRAWISWTLGYGAALAFVKFTLSPIAFEKADASLAGFVLAGVVVVPLYLAAVGGLYVLARRPGGGWGSRLGTAAGLAIVAVVTRLIVAFVLGNAHEYLHDLVVVGLIFPVVVAVASIAVMESFARAGASMVEALRVGIVVVVAQHVLWVVYMYRLFA